MEGVTRLDLDFPAQPFPALKEEEIQSSIDQHLAKGGSREEGTEQTDGWVDDRGEFRLVLLLVFSHLRLVGTCIHAVAQAI